MKSYRRSIIGYVSVGLGAVILPGQNYAAVAMGSVVTKDVPEDTVVFEPCGYIRKYPKHSVDIMIDIYNKARSSLLTLR